MTTDGAFQFITQHTILGIHLVQSRPQQTLGRQDPRVFADIAAWCVRFIKDVPPTMQVLGGFFVLYFDFAARKPNR